jgi:hypothetical protein
MKDALRAGIAESLPPAAVRVPDLDLAAAGAFVICEFGTVPTKRVMLRQGDDYPFAPQREHSIIPARTTARHDRDVDDVSREEQPILAAVNSVNLHLGKSAMVLGQRCVHVSGRERSIDANS